MVIPPDMNILLIHPSSYFKKRILNEITMPDMPLGLAYIAAVLEQAHHYVRIVDLNVIKTKDELKAALTDVRYEVVGFTSTTSNILTCYRTIHAIKKLLPWITTVLGGWHVSGAPAQTLRECTALDVVVKGEGEETMTELVDAIARHKNLSGIQGVVFRNDRGEIIENEDRPLIKNLDDIPFPARHLLPMEEYKKRGFSTSGVYFKRDRGISGIVTSRGCTGRCIFCADHTIYKHNCRLRSPENVIAEIKQVMKQFHVTIFFFQDAHFTQSPTRAKKICELIIKEKLDIIWACSARVDTVNDELLHLMKRAGCARIGYGIESGSPKMLKIMNKHVNFKQMRDAIRWTREVGMISFVYLVYGVPGETAEDIMLTRQLLMELKPDFVNQSIAIPYPGTRLREIALERNMIKNDHWKFYSFPYGNVIEYPGYEEMFKLQGKILRGFYTSSFFAMSMLKKFRSIYQAFFYFKVLRIYLLGFFLFTFGTESSIKRILSGITSRDEVT
jgi:anaerobic magnesium-protoporphyrin IX monomethyl ester cyclase